MIKEIKNTVPWTTVINDINCEKIIGAFYEKELQKINQRDITIEKVIKKKGNKLYVKWKGYDNSFNRSYMSNGKDMIIHLIAGLIKKIVK